MGRRLILWLGQPQPADSWPCPATRTLTLTSRDSGSPAAWPSSLRRLCRHADERSVAHVHRTRRRRWHRNSIEGETARQTGSGVGRVLAAIPPRASRRTGQDRPGRPRCRGVCSRGRMMRRRSSSSNSSVEARERASAVKDAVSRFGAVAVGLDHLFFGFSARQDGVDAARCPGQLVLQQGVGARGWPCARRARCRRGCVR